MSNATLTKETLILCPSDPLLDQLSKVKGILGLMGSLNCEGSLPIQNDDLGWTLMTLSEILEVVEKRSGGDRHPRGGCFVIFTWLTIPRPGLNQQRTKPRSMATRKGKPR